LMLTTECMIFDEPEKKKKDWIVYCLFIHILFYYVHTAKH
jgi:hypothetical protein